MQTQIIRQSPRSAGSDMIGAMENLARDAMRPWADAFDSWRGGMEEMMARAGEMTRSKKDCECKKDDCEPDPCQCSCCVADSDLIVEARVGERRVIPIIIENKWRRERQIEVQLSDWSCEDSDFNITGRIVDPLTFTIEPCGEHKLILLVQIGGVGTPNDPDGRERMPDDVKKCVVCYADLRIKGCDVRPIRIAVAVLPCECGAFHVDCCQACC